MLNPSKLLIAFFLLCFSGTNLKAIEILTTDSFLVKTNEVVSSEQWIHARSATIEGTLEKDLFIAAKENMELKGQFKGDIWGINTGLISFSGASEQDIRLLARTIQFEGNIDGNVMAVGETLKTNPGAKIQGDLFLAGTTILIEGRLNGDVTLLANATATISGEIHGSLRVTANEIIIQPNTRIFGDLIYTSKQELIINNEIVSGKLKRSIQSVSPEKTLSIKNIIMQVNWYLAALLTGIAYLVLLPNSALFSAQLIRTNTGKCILPGVLTTILLPITATTAISSLIGIPLGITILAIWCILLYLSRMVVAIAIAQRILNKAPKTMQQSILFLALGLLPLYAGFLIPGISFTLKLLTIWVGFGALVRSTLQRRQFIIQIPPEIKKQFETKKENYKNK